MKKYRLLLIFIFLITGCELIVIGGRKRPKPIDINQLSPVGAVLLFKTELDSNNIPAATNVLANPAGRLYLAIEKYEMYEEIERLGRIISNKSITSIKTDTLSTKTFNIYVQLDYLRIFSFTTSKIGLNWYITNYQEEKNKKL